MAKGNKFWINTWTEVEELGGGKFGASISVGHRVFFDKTDGYKPKRHKLTDNRPDYVLIQSAKCCVEVYPYYAKYFDVHHEQVRLHEERWVVQRWRDPPGKWQDVGVWNPTLTVEETTDCITAIVTYDTDYGPLVVKYIQRDGGALKHEITFTNTAASTETFRVVQAWAGIVGDKCNGKNIPIIKDAPYFAFHSTDNPQRRFNIAENLWSMVFNPDGTKKTNHCLQEPVSIETHAQGMKADFIYAQWVLAQNESLVIDPDTATLNNPTEDGYVEKLSTDSVCGDMCAACVASSPSAYTGGNNLLYGGFCSGGFCAGERAYIEWPISSLAGATLTANPVFKYHGNSIVATSEEINPITEGAPSGATTANKWDYIASGTAYVDPFNQESGATKQVDLGASAKTDLQTAMTASQSWFAIGLQAPSDECPCSEVQTRSSVYSEDYASVNPAPTLYVEYTVPIVVTPGTVSLTITEYAPILKETTTPSTLSLTITEYVPSIITGTIVTPPTLSLADTEYIPILREVTTPSTLNLALAFYAPSITIGKTVTPSTLSLTITAYAPILQEVTIPSTLSLTITEYAPSVTIGTLLTPATLNLTITSYIPVIGIAIIPPTLSLSDTEYIPVLKEATTPTTLSLTITEYTAVYGDGVVPPTLSLTITAYIPILKETTTPTTLSLTLTKYAAVYGDGVVPSTLSLTITEYASILKEVLTPTTLSLIIIEYNAIFGEGVVPSTLNLSDSEYAPILKEVTTPPTLNLALSFYVPILKEAVIPTTLNLNDTEYTPILKEVTTPTTLSLILTQYNAVFGEGLVPTTLSLTTASYIPILKEVTTPTTLSLILAAYVPILKEKVTAGLLSLALTRYNAVLGTGVIPGTLGLNTVPYIPVLEELITAGGVSLPITGYPPILLGDVIPNLANLITDTYAPTVRYCEWFDLPIKVPISRLDTEAVPISQLPTSRWVRRCK